MREVDLQGEEMKENRLTEHGMDKAVEYLRKCCCVSKVDYRMNRNLYFLNAIKLTDSTFIHHHSAILFTSAIKKRITKAVTHLSLKS